MNCSKTIYLQHLISKHAWRQSLKQLGYIWQTKGNSLSKEIPAKEDVKLERCSQELWEVIILQWNLNWTVTFSEHHPIPSAGSCYIKHPACRGANQTVGRLKLNSLYRQDRKSLEKGEKFEFFNDTYWWSKFQTVKLEGMRLPKSITPPKSHIYLAW